MFVQNFVYFVLFCFCLCFVYVGSTKNLRQMTTDDLTKVRFIMDTQFAIKYYIMHYLLDRKSVV